jgi:hypothetical protein
MPKAKISPALKQQFSENFLKHPLRRRKLALKMLDKRVKRISANAGPLLEDAHALNEKLSTLALSQRRLTADELFKKKQAQHLLSKEMNRLRGSIVAVNASAKGIFADYYPETTGLERFSRTGVEAKMHFLMNDLSGIRKALTAASVNLMIIEYNSRIERK